MLQSPQPAGRPTGNEIPVGLCVRKDVDHAALMQQSGSDQKEQHRAGDTGSLKDGVSKGCVARN